MLKGLKTFFKTIKDGIKSLFAPVSSFFNQNILKGEHHKNVGGTLGNYHKNIPQERIERALHKSKARNVALFDWDDTIIRWQDKETGKQSRLWKLKHRLINRPSDEAIDIIEGVPEFLKHLNASGVHTGLVSNKEHKKLLKQTAHHLDTLPFDKIIGHDRTHDFGRRKPTEGLPLHMLEEMGIDLSKGSEPVNVMFAGDKPTMDIRSANLLDKWLKENHNPASSCTSVLVNTRKYTQEQINILPASDKPTHIVNNYDEFKEIASNIFHIPAPEKATAHTVHVNSTDRTTAPTQSTNWVAQHNAEKSQAALNKIQQRGSRQ